MSGFVRKLYYFLLFVTAESLTASCVDFLGEVSEPELPWSSADGMAWVFVGEPGPKIGYKNVAHAAAAASTAALVAILVALAVC